MCFPFFGNRNYSKTFLACIKINKSHNVWRTANADIIMKDTLQVQRIMIVEEEQNTALLMATQLQANNFQVKVFTNPVFALDELKKSNRDYFLVISDMKMTQMPIFEFMRRIKSEKPDIKILLITTFEVRPNEFSIVLPSLKIEGLIAKPLLADKIIPSVNKIFGFSKHI